MTPIGEIAPATRAESIEDHDLIAPSHLLSKALHEHRLPHSSRAMNDQRCTRRPRYSHRLLDNRPLNQATNRWKSVRCGIELVLMIDPQFSKDCHSIDTVVGAFRWTGFNSHEIAQLQQPHFGF